MQILDRQNPQNLLVRPWVPATSIWETDSEVLISIDLPGVPRASLDIQVQGSMLVVSGQRQPAGPAAAGHPGMNGVTGASGGPQTGAPTVRPRIIEAILGPFRRVITLPPGTKSTEISANLRDGVLDIRIPREVPLTATPRTVPVS